MSSGVSSVVHKLVVAPRVEGTDFECFCFGEGASLRGVGASTQAWRRTLNNNHRLLVAQSEISGFNRTFKTPGNNLVFSSQ